MDRNELIRFCKGPQEKTISIKFILLLSIFSYMAANTLILFLHGVFWDDWCMYENVDGIREITNGIGAKWQYPMHIFLLDLAHTFNVDVVLIYRVIVYLIGIINVVLFCQVLKNFKFSNGFILWSTLIFSVWPLGYSHMLLCCFQYQPGVLFQLFALVFLPRFLEKRQGFLYILIFVFQFIASLFLQSTIVLWFGVLCLSSVYITHDKYSLSWKYLGIIIHQFISLSYLFIPCLIYWVLRLFFWMPSGYYAMNSYNEVSVVHIIKAPILILSSLLDSLCSILVIAVNITSAIPYAIFFILLSVVIYLCMIRRNTNYSISKNSQILYCFSILYCFCIGAYVLVGKVQIHDSVNDRNGILLPLSVVPMIVALLSYVRHVVLHRLFLSGIYSLLMMGTLFQYIEMLEASQKNDAIIEFFTHNTLQEGNIRVEDVTSHADLTPFYSWSGMYKKATKKQDHCFSDDKGIIYDTGWFLSSMYNQRDATVGDPNQTIIISGKPSDKDVLVSFVFGLLNEKKYKEAITCMYNIKIYKI